MAGIAQSSVGSSLGAPGFFYIIPVVPGLNSLHERNSAKPQKPEAQRKTKKLQNIKIKNIASISSLLDHHGDHDGESQDRGSDWVRCRIYSYSSQCVGGAKDAKVLLQQQRQRQEIVVIFSGDDDFPKTRNQQ
jgi:hypothetical protein